MNPLEKSISEHPFTQMVQNAFAELPTNALRRAAMLQLGQITGSDILYGAALVFWCLDKQERDSKLQSEQQVLTN